MLGLADVQFDVGLDSGVVHIPFADNVHAGSQLSLVAARHARMSPVTSIVADRISDVLAELP